MERLKKILSIVLAVCFAVLCMTTAVSAETKNSADLTTVSYSYDLLDRPYAIPSPFVYSYSVTGEKLGVGAFKEVSDVFYDDTNSTTIITDSGNNRIILLDGNMTVKKQITEFVYNGKTEVFSNPKSAIIKDGKLYIADTGNSRIVVMGLGGEVITVLGKPKINALGKDYIYSPYKLAVDDAGHIYVVAKDITDGVILLEADGKFIAFFGAPKVTVSTFEQLKKRFMTKEQRSKLYSSIPTEYNSISIDKTGFIIATTQSMDVSPLSRLNHIGENIFEKKLNVPAGDEVYASVSSTFIDAAEDKYGNYLALDNRRGRIFVYDNSGTMLACFGGSGVQNGTFHSAVAIEMLGENVAVADTTRNTVEVFVPTEFWVSLTSGIKYMNAGEYSSAKPYFNDVINRCSAFIPAHLNLGRIAYSEQDYKTAMKEFKYADDKDYYSLAYKQVRSDFINNKFGTVLAVIVAVIVLVLAYAILVKKFPQLSLTAKFADKPLYKKWKYVDYCSFHPFDGFWCVRREGMGSLTVANIIFAVFIIFFMVRTQFSAYLFKNGSENDVLVQTLGVVIPLMLWVIINWALSPFFDGKARFKDMYISMCYSLKPYLFASIILFPMTFFLVADEAFVYTILDSIVWVWMLGLMFFGTITVQDFSLGKGVLNTVFTMVGIALVVFLGLIIVNISQEMVTYFTELISEVEYRIT